MGTRRPRVTVHGVLADITEDWLGDNFAKFGLVEDVSSIISKTGITTSDFVLQVTMD